MDGASGFAAPRGRRRRDVEALHRGISLEPSFVQRQWRDNSLWARATILAFTDPAAQREAIAGYDSLDMSPEARFEIHFAFGDDALEKLAPVRTVATLLGVRYRLGKLHLRAGEPRKAIAVLGAACGIQPVGYFGLGDSNPLSWCCRLRGANLRRHRTSGLTRASGRCWRSST